MWFVTGDPRCSPRAREAIESAGRATHLSAATAWEISTKVRLGQWPEAEPLARMLCSPLDLTPLPISLAHAARAGSHPSHHRDPFDRMLAAQAELESLTLVTADPVFRDFGTRTLW